MYAHTEIGLLLYEIVKANCKLQIYPTNGKIMNKLEFTKQIV